ncbi:raffinose/stachyose/melibiose transport system permease protein [Gracilibacillus orientalis]|uniref:Raffinose/stachyose/melibiose transport system permease protein n=1 Tax=Gracilibacillus orientalis TaxID=334253 RepID=A0A1I4NAQ7_9BACI|nr:sugar ABC transporter permease [Gracilibacillus orientalis]SFM12456.1 raffinose/stachyose/melibiose transport system permease protein [Gracilibacillus orientalis]
MNRSQEVSLDTVRSGVRKKKKNKDTWAIIGFIAPAFIIYGVYVIYSIFMTFYYSMFDWTGIDANMVFLGLENYVRLFQDGVFWTSIQNNFLLVIASLFTQLPIGLIMALLLFSPIKGMRLFRSVYFMPFLMSTVAIGILFIFIYEGNYGLLNAVLGAIGLESLQTAWIGKESTAIWAVIATVCWQFAPFYMILFRATIVGIPEELYEAADIDGASGWQRFKSITLPLLMPIIITSAILSVIGSLKYFDLIYVMTGGGPNNSTELMATYMYKQTFTNFNMGYGSSISFSMFIIALIVTVFILLGDRSRRGNE